MSELTVREAIELILNAMPDERHVGSKTADEVIDAAERRLGVKFPDDFRIYLSVFGHGGVGGFDIMGLVDSDESAMSDDLVSFNEQAREEGLPNSLILVEEVGDGSYMAIDVTSGDRFGRIVVWPLGGDELDHLEEIASDFGDFALSRARDALEVAGRWRGA